jgi:hypothetical protein
MSTKGHTPITALQLFEPDARAVYTLDAVASLTRIKLIMDLVREVERLREELNFRQRRL